MRAVVTRKNRRSFWFIRIEEDTGDKVAVTKGFFTQRLAVSAASRMIASTLSEPWSLEVIDGA